MLEIPKPNVTNELLQSLPDNEFAAVSQFLDIVKLYPEDLIARAATRIEDVYFPASGLSSVIMQKPKGGTVEAGLIGRDGFVPTTAASRTDEQSFTVMVQIESEALRMDYSDFLWCLTHLEAFERLVRLYHEAFSVQIAFTAMANAIQRADLRLARWVLMCHDRMLDDRIAITHSQLSLMLGIWRPTITNALHVLEGHGFLKSTRKAIVVTNRGGLEEFAGELYGEPEARRGKLLHRGEANPTADIAHF